MESRYYDINIFSALFYNLLVIAIPVFFVINGYLLFGKTQKYRWYSYKKIGKILLLSFVLNILMTLLFLLVKRKFINPLAGMIMNLFFQKGFFWHFWFLGALIIIYICFPFLDYIYINKKRLFCVLSITFVVIQCLIDGLNVFYQIKYSKFFQQSIPQSFRLECSLSYFIIGGIIKLFQQKLIKKIKLQFVLILLSIVVTYQFLMVRYLYKVFDCQYFYDNFFIVLFVFCLFIYLLKIPPSLNIEHSIIVLANLTMPVYVIHPFIIEITDKYFDFQIPLVKLVVVYGISILLGLMINKLPYIKNLFKI
jgi:surface polysaccharide O-acyltransferase-like enzyme